MNLRRLWAIVIKELRQLRRDKLTFAMIVGIPTMQLLLFGFAINMDIRHLPAALMDEADTWRSRELVAELAASQVLEFTHRVSTPQDIDDLLRTGKIEAAVVIPAGSTLPDPDPSPNAAMVDGGGLPGWLTSWIPAGVPAWAVYAAAGLGLLWMVNHERFSEVRRPGGRCLSAVAQVC